MAGYLASMFLAIVGMFCATVFGSSIETNDRPAAAVFGVLAGAAISIAIWVRP